MGIGFAAGKIRWEREVVRERQIGDEKQKTIDSLIAEMKDQTMALNRVAEGVQERNKIEREMRGRRT
jgi:hypothetical protein